MRTAKIDERTRALAAISARQRDSLAGAMRPWRTRADRIDGPLTRIRAHPGWLGFLGGFGAGMLMTLRPRWLVPSVRVLAAVWPAWRVLQWQRDRELSRK